MVGTGEALDQKEKEEFVPHLGALTMCPLPGRPGQRHRGPPLCSLGTSCFPMSLYTHWVVICFRTVSPLGCELLEDRGHD